MEAMRGKTKQNKTQICHISFLITQLEDRNVAPKKNKNKLFKELLPLSCPFLPGALLQYTEQDLPGLFLFLPHVASGALEMGVLLQTFTGVEPSLRAEEYSD